MPSLPLEHCLPAIAASPLFAGLSDDELSRALTLLHARCHAYGREELIQRLSEPFKHVGVVITGCVGGSFDSERFDEVDVNRFFPGDAFGMAYACAQTKESPIQLEALEESDIVMLDVRELVSPSKDLTEANDAAILLTLTRNFLAVVSRQSTFLMQKVRVLGQKTLRDRVIVFLREQPKGADGWVELPFSQTTMASLIGANRSALSRELGRMVDDGLLLTEGRRMRLLT